MSILLIFLFKLFYSLTSISCFVKGAGLKLCVAVSVDRNLCMSDVDSLSLFKGYLNPLQKYQVPSLTCFTCTSSTPPPPPPTHTHTTLPPFLNFLFNLSGCCVFPRLFICPMLVISLNRKSFLLPLLAVWYPTTCK